MTQPTLTIGMLTYDDYDGVYFTIQAIRTYHSDVANQIRFLVVDNNPSSKHGKEVATLCRNQNDTSYYGIEGVSSTSLRNLVFELASTEHVLCLDCHVLLQPQALSRLIRFYAANPGTNDLFQGPLYTESNYVIATSMEPSFRGGNFGIWTDGDKRCDDPAADPFEIAMHGMGMFTCRRDAWPRFPIGMRGFGGEEGTIHEKFRLTGRKCWALPFLGWTHRFPRPAGVPYKLDIHEKVRNHLMTFRDAGLEITPVVEYYRSRLDGNPDVSSAKMDSLVAWSQTLPNCPHTIPAGYQPFLGKPIQLLADKPPAK